MKKLNDAGTLEEIIDALADEEWNADEWIEARDLLADQFGLGLLKTLQYGFVLAIPDRSRKVARMFEGSPWQNNWPEVLRQGPPDVVVGVECTVTIAGVRRRCTLFAVRALKQNIEEHGSRTLYG